MFLKQYLILGAAVVVLILTGVIAYQHRAINALEAEKAVLESTVAEKNALINAQNKGIDDLQKAATESAAKLKAAGDSIDIINAKLAAERARRNAAVETDYVLPDCAVLLATDLAAVCPAHAQRLRDAARLSGP